MSEMKDTDTSAKNAEALYRKEGEPESTPAPTIKRRRWPIVLTTGTFLAVAGGGIGAIWFFSAAFADITARATFVVGSAINLFIFLAIVAQACIYWAQRGIMNRQWEAMQEGLAETRKAMRYSQSAYITVKAIDATKFIVGENIEVAVIFTNNGNTPAYNVDTYSRGGAREEPFSFARDEIKTGFQHGIHSKGILAPDDVMTQVFGTDIPLTISNLARLKRKPYHAWGVIFYQDIFKRDRWTQFCYVWREKREWGDERGVFEICADCNKTDDQE
jgi:hypothetical protein